MTENIKDPTESLNNLPQLEVDNLDLNIQKLGDMPELPEEISNTRWQVVQDFIGDSILEKAREAQDKENPLMGIESGIRRSYESSSWSRNGFYLSPNITDLGESSVGFFAKKGDKNKNGELYGGARQTVDGNTSAIVGYKINF